MFEVHMLNEDGKRKAAILAGAFKDLVIILEGQCGPAGREMAIVRTKLEEACFFAKRAMAVNPESQQSA